DDAIQLILEFWQENKNDKYAGILGLDIYKNGQIVSNKSFPEGVKFGKYFELKGKYGLVGDIKFVYRTDVITAYPDYPIFPDEKFVPLGYKYLLIDQDYDMLFLNKALCVVEYRDDGSSKNIIKQYFNNPKGFLHERRIRMIKAYSFKERLFNTAHYILTSIILKDRSFLKNSLNKILTFLTIPLGIILCLYLRLPKRIRVLK